MVRGATLRSVDMNEDDKRMKVLENERVALIKIGLKMNKYIFFIDVKRKIYRIILHTEPKNYVHRT